MSPLIFFWGTKAISLWDLRSGTVWLKAYFFPYFHYPSKKMELKILASCLENVSQRALVRSRITIVVPENFIYYGPDNIVGKN